MKTHAIALSALITLTVCGPGSAGDFQAASKEQVSHIEYFLEEGLSLRKAYSAKIQAARETATGYFVAGEIVGSGGFVGVWWHGGTPDSPGMVMAVDHIADEACVCRWVRNTKSAVSMNDPPAKELKKYVEGLQ